MADKSARVDSAPLYVRVESGRLVVPSEIAGRIQNMEITDEGTLRSIRGPAPYLSNLQTGDPYTYSGLHGIFHCRLKGQQRDIHLIHDGDSIYVLSGWNRGWTVLAGPSSGQVNVVIPNDDRPRWPTQFEATPKGIVIVPQEGRALFYDGEIIALLGYTYAPGPPSPRGPRSSDLDKANDRGLNRDAASERHSGVVADETPNDNFGIGRVGTLRTPSGADNIRGMLEEGIYQAAVQWIDVWGNVSPLSGRSGAVHFAQEATGDGVRGDSVLKYIAWTGIEPGPDGTIGRILCRTRDIIHGGTNDLFEIPAYSSFGTLSFATMPDNVSTVWPDNSPDSWLFTEPVDAVPIPQFKLCRMAFGRLWIANTPGDPGYLHPSLPGRFGTFQKNEYLYPTTRGSEITGLWNMDKGLLVFSESSTYLIQPSDDGQTWRTISLSDTAGCVAPNSIGTLPNGMTIWLGREGFYGWAGTPSPGQAVAPPTLLSAPESFLLRRINKARRLQSCAAVDTQSGVYRCWIPFEASKTNNLCMEFDGNGWRRRTDVDAVDVCVTRDHRGYMLAAGKVSGESSSSLSTVRGTPTPTNGVWVLDHEVQSYTHASRTAVVETGWLRGETSRMRGSPVTLWLWLRETRNGRLKVEVMRDWRNTVINTTTARMYPDDQTTVGDEAPAYWGESPLRASSSSTDSVKWKKRRPFWQRVHLDIPSCEVFKIRISSESDWEFIGMAFDEIPKDYGGANVPD